MSTEEPAAHAAHRNKKETGRSVGSTSSKKAKKTKTDKKTPPPPNEPAEDTVDAPVPVVAQEQAAEFDFNASQRRSEKPRLVSSLTHR